MSEQFIGFRDHETEDGDVVPPEHDIDVRFTRDDMRANLADLLDLHPEHSYSQDMPTRQAEQVESDTLDRPLMAHQKAFILRNDFGFDAYSSRERNEAMENVVQRFAGMHLNEVLLHQQKQGTEDPAAALRSLIGEYTGFAKAAKSEAGVLGVALEDLDSMNPKASLDRVMDLNEGIARRVVSAIQSHMVFGEFIASEGKTPATVDKLTAEEASELSTKIASLSVGEVKVHLGTIIGLQERRHAFWIEHIKGARGHYAVRNIAKQALNRLGVEDIS